MLSLFVALLFVLPARLVVGPLGGAGRPAVLIGIGAGAWWALNRMLPRDKPFARNAIRQVLYVYLVVFTVTYLLGYARILPFDEARAADRAFIVTFGLIGAALLALDGIESRDRLDTLLKRLTVFGAFMAAVGILEFATGYNLAQAIKVPGLSLNRELIEIGMRGGPGFRRVAGTAGHPIEFGVVAAMLLPFALHYALFAVPGRERQFRWVIAAALALAVPFSISRSGTIALLTVMLCMVPVWARHIRHKALLVTVLGALLLRSTIPGLLGTIRGLFKNVNDDPSIRGRTNDYATAFNYISERPWFGRGPRTFLPNKYIVLDNQYLNSIITTGYVGLVAFVLLFLVGFYLGRRIYKSKADEQTRHLGQAFAAAILAAALTSFTFDSLAFATFAGVLFLLLGCLGALWRLQSEQPLTPHDESTDRVLRPRGRRFGASLVEGL